MQGDFQSTFQHDYQPWKSNKQKPYNYERQPLTHGYDLNLLKSQYQNEYIQRPLPEKEIRQLPNIYPSQPFTSTTDYRTNYTKYPLPQKRTLKKQPYQSAPRQIPWNTTYGNDFTQKPVGGAESFRPQVRDGPHVGTDFGTSTYQQSYIPLPNCKQERLKDPKQTNLYGDPGYTGNSTYQNDYIEKQPNGDMCPVLALPNRPNKLAAGRSHLNYDATTNRWL